MKIIINGKFLEQRITGVQRVARELLNTLDENCDDLNLELVYSCAAKEIPEFNNISTRCIGMKRGNFWEQWDFASYVRKEKGISLNLCNSAPLFAKKIVLVHDMKIKAHPEYYSKKFVFWYKILFSNVMKNADKIITVSDFSKSEIIKYYKTDENKIVVIGNGWQHYLRVKKDDGALEKYAVQPQNYCFSVSSLEPNKNLKWIIEVAKRNKDQTFIVAGGINKLIFSETFEALPPNVRLIGYVSDEEVKSLMSNCKLFLFPTFYEGFGIPPLEALSTGAKVVVTDSKVMHEVLGDSAVYVKPDFFDYNIETLVKAGHEMNAGNVLEKYSWEKSAEKLKELLRLYKDI